MGPNGRTIDEDFSLSPRARRAGCKRGSRRACGPSRHGGMEAGKRRLHELRQAVAFLKLNPIPIHDSLSVSRPLIIIRAAPAHWTSFTRNQDKNMEHSFDP